MIGCLFLQCLELVLTGGVTTGESLRIRLLVYLQMLTQLGG